MEIQSAELQQDRILPGFGVIAMDVTFPRLLLCLALDNVLVQYY
jgi:hypothetical protein